MRRIILFDRVSLAILLQIVAVVVSVKLNCTFKYKAWPVIGNVYSCVSNNINVTQPNDPTTVILGNHKTQKLTNANVRAFDITKQTCFYIPGRIKNFFINLELLSIVNSNLQNVAASDLKPFVKLRVLLLSANNLATLDNDLFQNNPELVRIDFRDQKFKLIGYNILENVKKISIIDFTNAGCMDYLAEGGRDDVKQAQNGIRINCQPIDEFSNELKKIHEKLNNLSSDGSNVEKSAIKIEDSQALQKISTVIEQVQKNNQKCVENFESFLQDYNELRKKVEALEKSLGTPEASCQYCKTELEELRKVKRELSSIELKCEIPTGNVKVCSVRDLRILRSDIEVTNVNIGIQQKNQVALIEDLKAANQEVFYLPTNLNRFFPNLKSFSFFGCKINEIGPEPFKQMPKLTNLVLAHNIITNIHQESFRNLVMLNVLDLSYNNLNYIQPGTFENLQKLSVLKLNHNRLELLTDQTFNKLSNLQFLFIQNNKLQKIAPNTFDNLKALNLLDLTNNNCVNFESTPDNANPLRNLNAIFSEKC